MKKVLLDTDVIIDCLISRDPFSQHSIEILKLCELGEICAYISPISLSNLYYVLRKQLSHQKLMVVLTQLLKIVQIANLNKLIIQQAIESEFKDFEDALQNYYAVNEPDVQTIVTRNIKDYKKSSLPVMTPENYLAFLRLEN
jgi:predicted nucleic acid-binding protein